MLDNLFSKFLIDTFHQSLLIVSFFYLFMGIIGIYNRRFEGAKVLTMLMFTFSLYSFGYFMLLHPVNVSLMRFFMLLEFIGIVFIPSLWIIFVVQFTNMKFFAKPVFTYPLIATSVINFLIIATNDFHHLYYKNIDVSVTHGHSIPIFTIGVLYNVNTFFYILSFLISGAMLIYKSFSFSSKYKCRYIFLFISSLFPLIAFVLFYYNKSPLGLDIVPLGLILTGITGVLSLSKVWILPVAHSNAFESIDDGILIIDLDDIIVDFNNAAVGMLGEKINFVGKAYTCVLDLIDLTKGTLNSEKGMLFVELKELPIQNSLNQKTGKLLIIKDITSNSRLQTRYQNLFDTMIDAFAIHDIILDEDGNPVDYRYIDVNSAFENITGMKAKDIIGKTVKELFPETEQVWIETYGQVAITGISTIFENYSKAINKYFHVVAYQPDKGQFACVFIDITDRKLSEQKLYEEKERLDITLRSIGDGVISTDNKGIISIMNPVAEKLTGWTQAEAEGKKLSEIFNIINENTKLSIENPVEQVLQTQDNVSLSNHTLLISKDGNVISIADSASPIKDKIGNMSGVVLVFRDVTEERKKQEDILYLSYHDHLTGLYNRTYLEMQLKKLDTVQHLPLTIILGDVNGLKLVNDVFGHNEGDSLLKAIADILTESSPIGSLIARWGGDEFIILLPNIDYDMCASICNNIAVKCEAIDFLALKPSIALGYASKDDLDVNVQDIIKLAEDNMYKHKLLEGRSTRSSIISSLQNTLYEKSYETEEHAHRISIICRRMGEELQLSQSDLDELELLGMLHDIGKIVIDSQILDKPGKLNDIEWVEMQRHSEVGFRIAQSSYEILHIADYILCHHERWDGKGYPQKLEGEDIPLFSRILTIADSYDAMTHDRVYKRGIRHEDAIAEIKRCRGNQFDPQLVDVFLKVIELKS